jgi:acetolactate decarboxylase
LYIPQLHFNRKLSCFRLGLLSFAFNLVNPTDTLAQASGVTPQINIMGQMKDVMWKGQLQGKIRLDTLLPQMHLYGLGPLTYLSGEIIVLEGKAYKASVTRQGGKLVEETFSLEAPFFGYSHIAEWE